MHASLGRLLNHCGGTISINTTWHHICQEKDPIFSLRRIRVPVLRD
jgi:hypothetical protein